VVVKRINIGHSPDADELQLIYFSSVIETTVTVQFFTCSLSDEREKQSDKTTVLCCDANITTPDNAVFSAVKAICVHMFMLPLWTKLEEAEVTDLMSFQCFLSDVMTEDVPTISCEIGA
ncbi:uncharacterized protein V6R79_012755, partial [Siganus canaliculatus]